MQGSLPAHASLVDHVHVAALAKQLLGNDRLAPSCSEMQSSAAVDLGKRSWWGCNIWAGKCDARGVTDGNWSMMAEIRAQRRGTRRN